MRANFLRRSLFLFFSVLLSCGLALADVTVTVSGPAGKREQTLAGDGGSFAVNLPLAKNAVNKINVTATDDLGNSVSQDISLTQISYESLVVAEVKAEPLSVERVEQLVNEGVINITDPDNFTVSQFDIVLTIAQEPVHIEVPIVVPKGENEGFETIRLPKGDGGGGRPLDIPDLQIIVFQEILEDLPVGYEAPPIPGVILIEGRVKTLKEFFSVKFMMMNTSGIFTLKDVRANLEFPDGGLANIMPTDGIALLEDILPGNGNVPGQRETEFIVRGDERGTKTIRVNYGGKVAGPGIAEGSEPTFNGTASTTIEVKGPPTFLVEVNHPDNVTEDEPYELSIDFTNTGDTPALYTSFQLDLGQNGSLVDCQLDDEGEIVCQELTEPVTRSLGHILPGQKVRTKYTVMASRTGAISSCLGMSDQNISLHVNVGSTGCLAGQSPPARVSADGSPAVTVLPANKTIGVHIDSPVAAFFSSAMNTATITTGANGSFNVYDRAGARVQGTLSFETLNGKTVAIWQVLDGITNRLQTNTEYTVELKKTIFDTSGRALVNDWTGKFTTSGVGINDSTPPEIALTVLPPVNPNAVIPGQIAQVKAFPSDMGSGISRVEVRMRNLTQASPWQLTDQKFVSPSNQPPFLFAVDSKNLVHGDTYELRVTAYDGMLNAQDATVALVIATSGAAPTVTLPDDTGAEVKNGVNLSIAPTEVTGGVIEANYFVDANPTAVKTVTLSPYNATLSTLGLALGVHTVRVVVVDGLGQTGQDTYTFSLVENTTAPVVQWLSPVGGSKHLQSSIFTFNTLIQDEVGISTIKFFLDDPLGSPIYTGANGFALNASGLSLGVHTMYVEATNQIGLKNNLSDPASAVTFEVVNVLPGPPPSAPSVTSITAPADGKSTVTGTTSVSGGRVDITNIDLGAALTVMADGSGYFTAIIEGDTGHTLSLTAFDVSQTQESPATNRVIPAPKVLVSIDASAATVNFATRYQTAALTVIATYNDASTADITSQASYSSSNTAVASVNSAGQVVGLNGGSATITVSMGSITDTVAVNSGIRYLTGISVSPSPLHLSVIGQTQQLVLTADYSDETSEEPASGVTYISSNPSVVTVTSSGLARAIADGSATITAAMNGVTPVVVPVVVNSGEDPLPTAAILSPTNGSDVEPGQSVTIQVRGQDTFGGVREVTVGTSGQASYTETKQVSPTSLNTVQSFTFSVPGNAVLGGTITVSATAQDTSLHNSATAQITLNVVDATAPTLSINAPSPDDAFLFGETVTVRVSAADAVGVTQIRYTSEGGVTSSGTRNYSPAQASPTAEFSMSVPWGISQPTATIRAYARDASGNEREALSVEIVFPEADSTAPETQVTAVADPGSAESAVVSYTVTSGLSDLDHVELFFRRSGYGTFNRYTDADGGNASGKYTPQSGADGSITFNSRKAGGDGDYEFYTVGVDVNGNREAAPVDGSSNVLPDAARTFAAGTVFSAITSTTTIAAGDTSYDNQNLRIDGATVTIDGAHSFKNVELLNGAVITHSQTTLGAEYGLELTAWTLTIDSTSSINTDGRGYLGGYAGGNDSTGQTNGNVDGASLKRGGSYGGLGGIMAGSRSDDSYGSITNPLESGSGGGGGEYLYVGGDGGGRIKLALVNLVADGTVSSGGTGGTGYSSASGAGGSINIVASTISGSGAIRADGGGGEVGGGGGRVAATYVDISTLDTADVTANAGAATYRGANGTVYLRGVDQPDGTLVVEGQGGSLYSSLPIPPGMTFDNIIIKNNARVLIDSPLTVSDTLSVLTGSIVTHSAESETGLQITAQKVIIDATGSIDVSQKGYRGGLSGGNVSNNGLTLGGVAGATYRAGASFGGSGAPSSGNSTNGVYGNPLNPVQLGSGGGAGQYDTPGGNGGGRVSIVAAKRLEIDGTIHADGGAGDGYAASGSGGSIKIATSLLKGSGTISANGGSNNQLAGGGGRVYISYNYTGGTGEDLGGLRQVTAFGGRAGASSGSAGTVVFKRNDQTYGTLYIDDNYSGQTAPVSTKLPIIGFGTVQALSADTLTVDGSVSYLPSSLVGLRINPDLTQDRSFVITANTENTLTVDTSEGTLLTDVAETGDSYAGVYLFNELVFRRGGYLLAGDELHVSGTALVDDYGRLSHPGSTLSYTSKLSLNVGTLSVTSTGTVEADGKGYLGGLRSGNDCSAQTLNNADGANYKAGGSYGGKGAVYGSNTTNALYGNPTNPADLGSGGACGEYDYAGGNGGGLISISATTATVDGSISASGGGASGYNSAGGSGGSINIQASSISGSGTVAANGAGGEIGGGGGRIAVRYSTLSLPQANFTASGGQGVNGDGGNGTLFFKSAAQLRGDLVIDGAAGDTPSDSTALTAGLELDNVTLRNNARVITDYPIVVNGTLSLSANSRLSHTQGLEAGLDIQTGTLSIDSTSAIDVTGKGFHGGRQPGNTGACEGVTLGGQTGAGLRAGGSYGGYAGRRTLGYPNPVYGSPARPEYLGSGGGCGQYDTPAGNGGGRITILATSTVDVDGAVRADGNGGQGYEAGSGSGGSISIACDVLRGSGQISASGAGGDVGGGGGRIRIDYSSRGPGGDDLSEDNDVVAYGGHGNSAVGSAGSVLIRQTGQTYGDLYIDEGLSGSTNSIWSPLTRIGFGEVQAITADTLTTDGTVSYLPNSLVGMWVNPNTAQSTVFEIISNTADTLTVDISGGATLTDVAQVGDDYAGLYRFDNLVLRNGGFLVAGDKLDLQSGLSVEATGRLTHYDATLNSTSRLELTAGSVVVDAAGTIEADARGYLGGLHDGNDCSGQTVNNTDGATYRAAGSYGGLGGALDGVTNALYGSAIDPRELGSGGSCGQFTTPGGDGGGLVSITTGTLVVNGILSADGAGASGYNSASGSGGSVNITVGTLSGSGTIRANGAGGDIGGGGGRVAVSYGTNVGFSGTVEARGATATYSGQNGTVSQVQQ